MSRDVITVGSIMRILLLYQGEYSQWCERFMNYLEEQTDGEAMINPIQNGDKPLPVIAQVSLAGTAQNAPPTLKDPKFWTAEEKKIRKIDRLVRSLLIQGLPNDIYSLIDSNEIAKDLWDALERQMRGSEYVINDLKKCGYKKDKCELNYKFLNNMQPEWKQYGTLMRQTKNLMYINIDALYNILKQNQCDVNDALGYKKKAVMVTSDPLALVAEKMKVSKQKEKVVVSSDSEGSGEDDFSELKKFTASLAKAFNRRKFYSKPTNNNLRTSSTSQSTNNKQEFVKSDNKKDDEKKKDMSKVKCYNYKKEGHFAKDCKKAKIKDYNYYKTKMLLAKKDSDEQVLSESDENSSSPDKTITEVAYYTSESESEYEFKTLEYYDNSTNYGLFVNNDDDQEIFHDAIESASENFIENHIDSQKDYDKSEVDHNDSEENEHLVDNLEIEKFKRARENKIEFAYDYGNMNASYVNEKINFSDDYFQEIINLNFEKIDSPFQQTSSLKPYVLNVILEKIIIDLEDEVVSLLKKEKANLKTIKSLKTKGFESRENAFSKSENQCENDCHVVEKECDQVENSKVIAPRMFKLSVSQSVSPISMSKTSCESNNVKCKLKRKRRKRKSSQQNDKQVNNDVLHANRDFVHFSDLDTFSSVRRPKHSGVIWKKKGSSNTSNIDLSSVSLSKLNKDVKRYSRKDLLSCNNSHLGETSSAYVCNDAMSVSCNSRMCDLFDENNLFILDDKSVRISPVSKMPFRKKPRDSMNVCSKSNSNKSLPRTVHKWLPKLQQLAEPVAKWIPRIIDSGCSKHMTGNRALLTNFVEKFLGTVHFGNNDFAVIAGYGDVVIKSMTIKKVYYVKVLGHNIFSVGQFCDKGLEVAFRKST
nr:integrase, catalytic region, zinc finger, CCHC-type, peptidase aspartic, catalytic [Tanacetum cinerariifolium]